MEESHSRKHASAGQVFHTYFEHIRRYPFFVSIVIAGGVVLQLADLAAPWYMRKFFNVLAMKTPDADLLKQLFGLIVIVASIWLVSWAARRIQDLCNAYFEARVMRDLFSDAFEYLIGHSYNFFISHFAGSLTHRVSKFARAFETLFDAVVLQFFPTFLFVVGAVTVLSIRNHVLGAALGVWTIAFIAFQVYVVRLRQPVRAARAEADTRVTGTLADAISNHATIMLFSGQSHEHRLFNAVVDAWRAATWRSWFADNIIWSGIGLFMLVIEVGLLWGATVYWGRGMLTIGDFVLIQAYLLTTFDRLVSINRELRRFNDAFADSSEMVYILEEPHGVQDVPGAKQLSVVRGAIAFRNVCFSFHSKRPVLKDFTLVIKSSEKVALVGPSGAGKSTVTKLLLRTFDIQEGVIAIDDQDISQVTQKSLRDAISFVPQEPILFHRTLLENIRYGRRDATDLEVLDAAKKAHCHEFISALPDQYETFVGERGVKLSGGERQRVAIARAILKNAPILVLDEATSSLDSESESLIQDALEILMRGKTVVVIAHRLSTIMKMDRIVVIDLGKIIAEGTHAELLAKEGLYKKLWNIQAGGFLTGPEPKSEDVEDIEEESDDEEKDFSAAPVTK